MAQNLTPPPIPTRSPMLDAGGLVSRAWISWFTWVKDLLSVSPQFTGIPTVPTAAPLTNNDQVASTGYADAAVAVETDRAEGVEQTLTTGLAAEVARAAPSANPIFTGVVTQPQPSILTGAIVHTTASTGAATALPALPAGYLETSINGTTFLVPYFNA